MSDRRNVPLIRWGIVAAVLGVAMPAMPAAAVIEFPKVVTAVDSLQVTYEDQARKVPQVVSWRTTGEVEADIITKVPETTLGQTRYVERPALGEDVRADFPVTIRGTWTTPWCSGSGRAAEWIHGSDFVSRGHSWAGLQGSEIGLQGYREQNAPDGSKLQWAELGVGGFNRFPPQESKPGGHMVGRDFGRAVHDLTWLDPSESCFIGGVRQVDQNFTFGIVGLEAAEGDVTLSSGDDLPVLETRLAGDNVGQLRGYAVVWAEGVPGVAVGVDTVVLAAEDGSAPTLRISPFAATAGTWRESRPSRQGTDWQLRFFVFSWTETIDFGSQMGSISMHPGERALVVTREGGEEQRRDLRADTFSELRIGTSETSLAEAGGTTPFPDLNSCGLDEPKNGFEVVAPSDPGDPNSPTAMRSVGLGDPDLPYSVPPGWLGFDLERDQIGAYSLEGLTIGGWEFGSAAAPYVSVGGGPPQPLTADMAIEGPIFYERQYPIDYADTEGGIAWDTVMLATVYRVDGVDLTLYWIIHAKVMGDSRGIGGCAYATALISEAMSPEAKDVELVWFVRANLRGAGKTYARQYRFDGGQNTYPTVATEKTWDRGTALGNGWLLDDYRFLGIRDKEDPEQRWMFQHWDHSSGTTALTRYHGTKASDPASEVDGEDIDGADIGLYVTSPVGGSKLWTHKPFLIFPCGPCGSY